jgi:hypothetical protein
MKILIVLLSRLTNKRGRIANDLWFLGFVVGFGPRPKRLGQVSIGGGKW